MGYIKEEITNDDFEFTIMVEEPAEDETVEVGEIISLSFDGNFRSYTPDALIDFGKWIIEQAERVKKEYNENGVKV